MQEVKSFVYGQSPDMEMNTTPLDHQINTFLINHPNYIAKSISMLLCSGYKEAMVIFDVREQRDNKDGKDQREQRRNKS